MTLDTGEIREGVMAEKQQNRVRRFTTKPVQEEVVDEADELDELEDGEELDPRALTAGKGRATPGRRQEDDEDGGNIIIRTIRGLGNYFDGVRSELKKVSWPTREETRRLTIIVLVTLIVMAILLGVIINGIFTELFRLGLNNPLILLGFMVLTVGGGFLFYQFRVKRSSNT